MCAQKRSREDMFAAMRLVTSRATDQAIYAAIDLGNQYAPDVYGRFPWDLSERRGKQVGLSKAGLGAFVYEILSCGGGIDSFFCMAPTYKNSSVFIRVHLSMAQKEYIEENTKYRFDPPPIVSVS